MTRAIALGRGTSIRFRAHPGALLMWGCAHAILWTVLGLGSGVVEYTDAFSAMLFGASVGLAHALLQWFTTSVTIIDGMIVNRNFLWVQRVEVEDVEAVQRIRRRSHSAVALRFRNGQGLTLVAPISSVLAPNPHFEEDLTQFCSVIAFGINADGNSGPGDDWV